MSAARSWLAEAGRVAGARAALGAAVDRARAGAIDEALFEAAGRLVALGEGRLAAEALAPLAAGRAALAAAAARALGGDEAEGELEDAAVALREALRAWEESADEGALEACVGEALAARDRAEFRLLGAALALGSEPDGVDAGVAGRLEFEQLVRPELWRLCALNPARRAASLALAPALRARFWWWHEGSEIVPGALAALPAVAALVAAFPGARGQLESLVRAGRAWATADAGERPAARPLATADAAERPATGPLATADAAERPATGPLATADAGERPGPRPLATADASERPAPGSLATADAGERPTPRPVYTLRDWVERRARVAGAGGGVVEAFPVAAAPADEVLLLDGADLQLSWSPPAGLIVDLLSDRAPGEVPVLRLADGSSLRADAVEGAEERYAFALPERAFGEVRACLIVPLARGPLELTLPPGGEREG